MPSFRGNLWFLSNFYPAPIQAHGKMWPTSEHLYQAMKTLDMAEREMIRHLPTPGEAKRAGRNVHKRPDWDSVKAAVMEEIIDLKFSQHPELVAKLLATGSKPIIELNEWHDTFWGRCTCSRHNGEGLNTLGRIIENFRTYYAEVEEGNIQ